jgi:hypothetical protein
MSERGVWGELRQKALSLVASLVHFSKLFLEIDSFLSVLFLQEIVIRNARTNLYHDFNDAFAELRKLKSLSLIFKNICVINESSNV